ncbi:hypothetical protein GCM10029964_078240 [Kibdelosporangium lantanae]
MRVDRPADIPLSPAQRRLWFRYRFDGHRPNYHVGWAVRISGPLDQAALADALTDVLARHESLRTVFVERDGEVYQRILPARQVLRTVSGLDLAAATRAPFDLTADIPIRATLHRESTDEHVLLLVMHHIAADGGSIGPLAADLSRAYASRTAGHGPDWPPLPVRYTDFALWQEEVLGDAGQERYWRETLAGLPDLLELPADRPRPAVAGMRSGRVQFTVDSALRAGLDRLARAHGVTLFMVVHAAIAALMTRMGAGTDIPVGAAASGRDHPALDGVVGFFVNTLVLRTDTAGDPSFAELLRRVRRTDLAAYANQDVPFERLVELLNPTRSTAHHPLYQVMLTYDTGADTGLDLPGLVTEAWFTTAGATEFDLSFFVTGTADGHLDYATDLFDHDTAAALVARLVRVLRAACADPDAPISKIDLLSTEERHQLVVTVNDTAVDVPTAVIPDLFAAQAKRVPDAVAVVAGTDQLTYARLDQMSNRLARYLVGRGVGPDQFVAVALPKSTDLVVAFLAVLKAGAAYLAIDLGYPADRIAFMLDDLAPVFVLTHKGVPVPPGPEVIELDDTTAAGQPGHDLDHRPHPASAAVAIYTSGSTGRPKAVVVEHRSLNQYLAWARNVYPAVGGRVLMHSSVAFDLSLTGIYAPLTAGGCVELIDLDERTAPRPAPTS